MISPGFARTHFIDLGTRMYNEKLFWKLYFYKLQIDIVWEIFQKQTYNLYNSDLKLFHTSYSDTEP